METETIERRYDIDWLRIIAMITVFTFHCACYFNVFFNWHVKNPEPSMVLTNYVGFVVQWMMPLFFVLSAFSIFYSLGIRKTGTVIKERFFRLVVPLIFGTLVFIVPVQVWIERMSYTQYTGSFFDFYITEYFNGLYGPSGGNFPWMGLHLWYLEFLFIFTLILLPVFIILKKGRGQKLISRIASFFKKPFTILLFALPVVIVELFVNLQPRSFIGQRDFGGWSLITYFVIFLLGYIIASNPQFQESLEKSKIVTLILAIIGMVAVFLMFPIQPTTTALYLIKFSVGGLNAWFWVAAILGFAFKYLRFNNRFLKYGTRAVLPFYILHQTVIVIMGYLLIDWRIEPVAKYFILAITSFIIVIAIYHLIIKRISILGFLFGMKPKKKMESKKEIES